MIACRQGIIPICFPLVYFMMSFFTRKPVLDEASVVWLFDVYDWCLKNFDAAEFASGTVLVLPSNDFFPGRENSVQGMAELMFERVRYYAGMAHWPVRLVNQSWCPSSAETLPLTMDGTKRGGEPLVGDLTDDQILPVGYDAALINNPEALIASFAQALAQYLAAASRTPAPGGVENWGQATEVLGVFLGFGVMFCNTAFVFKNNKCGSCGGANAERRNYLSEHDITYALAIFCTLKQIEISAVSPHLKKSLRGFFKKSMKDVQGRDELLRGLRFEG